MSDERTGPIDSGPAGGPRPGSLGPTDPTADPPTAELRRPVDPSTPTVAPTVAPASDHRAPSVSRTRTGVLWAGSILSAIVLIFLLVFILQNGDPVQIYFLGWGGTLPTGVALLLAAIAGLLLVAIPGSGRIIQLRRGAKHGRAR